MLLLPPVESTPSFGEPGRALHCDKCYGYPASVILILRFNTFENTTLNMEPGGKLTTSIVVVTSVAHVLEAYKEREDLGLPPHQIQASLTPQTEKWRVHFLWWVGAQEGCVPHFTACSVWSTSALCLWATENFSFKMGGLWNESHFNLVYSFIGPISLHIFNTCMHCGNIWEV